MILYSLLVGVYFHRRQPQPPGEWSASQLFRIGVIVHMGMLALMSLTLFRLDFPELLQIWYIVTLPVLTLYPLATVLLGRILSMKSEQVRLLRAARAEEFRLREIIESAPVAMAMSDVHGGIFYQNERCMELFGYTIEETPNIDVLALQAFPDPAYRQESAAQWRADFLRAERADGLLPEREYRVTCKSGAQVFVELSASIIGNYVVLAFNDVTARRQSERDNEMRRRLYAMLSHTNQLITHGAQAEALFEGVCRIAVEEGGFKFVWYGAPREDGRVIPLARFGEDGGYIDALNIAIDENDPRGRGPTGQALRTGSIVITNDFPAAVSTTPWRAAAAFQGVASSGVFPVQRRGELVGVFNFYSGEKDFFTPERAATLEEIAADVSFALDTMAVADERARAMVEVESLSARMRHYLAISPVISYALVMEHGRVHAEWVSENIQELLGFTVEEVMVDGWWASNLHAADRDAAVERIYEICELGRLRHEYRFHRKDGSMLWVLDSMRLESSDGHGKARVFGAWTDVTQ